MTIPDGELEMSPLGGSVRWNGHTLRVYIYRFAGTADKWTLEVVDLGGHTTVWDLRFLNDAEAYEAFEQAIADNGIRSFLGDAPVTH